MKENHSFIYFHGTGYKHMTRKLQSYHQVAMSTLQETAQGICRAIFLHSIRRWETLLPSIFSFSFMFRKRFDKFNKLIPGPSLQSNSNTNERVSKEKPR